MTELTPSNHPFEMDVMLFNVGTELYAIDLRLVKEIILPPSHLAQLPITPPLLRGLILSRNDIYPLVHLSKNDVDLTDDGARLILLTEGERRIALYTEHLHDILLLSSENRVDDGSDAHQNWILGAFETPKGNIFLLDFEQLYTTLVSQAGQIDSIPIS
jgi:chemotaxis signal transduction protein